MSKNNQKAISFFTKNRTTKLVVLLISFVFWLFVKLSKEYRTSATLKLDWVMPDSLAWRDVPPNSIHVSYRGDGWSLMRSYAKKGIEVTPNNLAAGNLTFERRELLPYLENHFLKGVTIIDFTPDNFVLKIDKRLQKKLPVKVNADPQFLVGYIQKGPILIKPDSVTIAGPEEIINNLTFVETELWKPTQVKSSIINHKLRLDDHNQTLSIQPNVVLTTLTMEQFTEKSFFVPISLLNAKDSVRIFPDKVKISFSVPLSQFDLVNPKDFELAVDFAEIKSGSNTNTLPIQVRKQPTVSSNLRFRSQAIEFFVLGD